MTLLSAPGLSLPNFPINVLPRCALTDEASEEVANFYVSEFGRNYPQESAIRLLPCEICETSGRMQIFPSHQTDR